MHFMAGLTTPSFPGLIHMQIVKILLTIPEIREGCGRFIQGDVFVMALKADRVSLFAVGIIEFWRKEVSQNLRAGRAMGKMAGVTVIFLNRPMTIFTLGHICRYLRMTREAKLFGSLLKELRVRRSMRQMACHAIPIFHRLVLHSGRLNLLFETVVAIETQGTPRVIKELMVWGTMSVMTTGAGLFHRFVDIWQTYFLLYGLMAQET